MKKKTLGWKDKIDFIDWGLENLDIKIDTGARTSVIHCKEIALIKKYRKNYVKFILLDDKHPQFSNQEFILPFHKEKKVKNSFGHEENRFIVKTTVKIYGKKHEIEISLRDRSNLEFPVLLGRSFIRKKYIIDVTKADLNFKQKTQKQSLMVK